MLGLIKKDLLVVKSNLKMFAILLIAFVFMALNGSFEIAFFLPFMCIMVFVSTFSYDDFNHWNTYAITLPCGRKTIVKSKYVASLILTILFVILGGLLSYMILEIKGEAKIGEIVSSLLGSILSVSLILSVMYPLNFKYGSEKGRMMMFSGMILVAIILAIGSNYTKFQVDFSMFQIVEQYEVILIPMLSLLLVEASYLLSKHIYLKKEF